MEITDEMRRAGGIELDLALEAEAFTREEIAEQVFRAMLKERRQADTKDRHSDLWGDERYDLGPG